MKVKKIAVYCCIINQMSQLSGSSDDAYYYEEKIARICHHIICCKFFHFGRTLDPNASNDCALKQFDSQCGASLHLQGGVQAVQLSMLDCDFVVWHSQSTRFLASLVAPLEGGALAPV